MNRVAEVLFYHLSATPVEATLPELLEKSLARGWRVLVRAGSDAGLGMLSDRLWSYRDDAFLPHGLAAGPNAARQPILLTCGTENPNRSDILMLVLGARAEVAEISQFSRVCLLFDGADAASLAAARADWRAAVAAGIPAKYWTQEGGRWSQKAVG